MGCSGSLSNGGVLGRRGACGADSASWSPAPLGGDTVGSSAEGYPSPAPLYTPGPRFSTGLGALTPSSDDSCSVASVGSDVDGMPTRLVSNTSELSPGEPPMIKVLSNSSWASTRCTVESEEGASCLSPGLTTVKPERVFEMEKMILRHVQTNACAPDPDDVLLSMAAAEDRLSERPDLLGATPRGGLAVPQADQKIRRVTFSSAPPEVLIVDDRLVTRSLKDFPNPRRIDKELLDPELQRVLVLAQEQAIPPPLPTVRYCPKPLALVEAATAEADPRWSPSLGSPARRAVTCYVAEGEGDVDQPCFESESTEELLYTSE